MNIRQFLEIANFYGAKPSVRTAVKERNDLFFGTFALNQQTKYFSGADCLKFFDQMRSYFDSTNVHANHRYIDEYSVISKEKIIQWDASVFFISDGYKKIVTGTASIQSGRIENYEKDSSNYFKETKKKKGFLGITFFPPHEKFGVGIIPNNPLYSELIKTYHFNTSKIKDQKAELFVVNLHKVPVVEGTPAYLKNFIVQ